MVYALFGSLASLNIYYSACCSRHSVYVFFSIDSYHALKISLNHRDQTENPSLKDFSKNSYTFTYFCHHTAIYSFRNWFICFDFGYFFYNKDFFAFCKVFSTPHITQGIIKQVAWTISFLEERPDFEITWLIWNANNPTMSLSWPKNIHLYLKRLQLIQNAWRMNLIKLISWVALYIHAHNLFCQRTLQATRISILRSGLIIFLSFSTI